MMTKARPQVAKVFWFFFSRLKKNALAPILARRANALVLLDQGMSPSKTLGTRNRLCFWRATIHPGYSAGRTLTSSSRVISSSLENEMVMFADAVHPTYGAQPVGCWAPKIAVEQTTGREHVNIQGAIDLHTGTTCVLEVPSVDQLLLRRPRADDDAGDPGLGEQPGQRDLRHRDSVLIADFRIRDPGRFRILR